MTLMFSMESPVEILRALSCPFDDHNFNVRYRSDSHALHLYLYHGIIRTDEGDYPVHPGDVSVTPAGMTTRYSLPEPGVHLCIHFRSPPGGGLELPFLVSTPGTGFAPLFRRIIAWRRKNEPEYRHAAENGLKCLLFQIYASAEEKETPGGKLPAEIVHHLEQHLTEAISIADLAFRHHISSTHLARLFKKAYGCTISQYIMRGRIERADLLLESSNLSIKEIGTQVGYATPQEFYKRYRQLRGISPSEHREKTGKF